jgi:glycosyltransferase 2 family protein
MSKRKWLGLGVKLLLTFGLFWLILRGCDWTVIRQRLGALSAGSLSIIVGLMSIQLVVLALRWCWITDCMGFRLPLRTGVTGQLISQFFSQGLPASLGGDGVRIWWLTRIRVPLQQALENVLFDRLAGFFSLLLLTQLSLGLLVGMTDHVAPLWSLAVVSGAGLAALAALLLPWRTGVTRLLHFLPGVLGQIGFKVLHIAVEFRRLLRMVSSSPRACARVLGSSLTVHMLSVLLCFIIATELGVAVSFWQCMAAVAPALLVAYLPLSIAGWGVREGAMVVAFGLIDVPAVDAVVISVTLGLGYLFVALCGGVVWLVGGVVGLIAQPPTANAAPEQQRDPWPVRRAG